MAIVDGLTTLADVKAEAGISDTSQDALIEMLINEISSAIRIFTDRELTRTTHTDEPYSVNACQYLYLSQYPVQSVTSITLGGVAQALNTDYFMGPADASAGRLYRPNGWVGTYYSRGTFPDVYAGARDIKVTYVSGYYLPDDPDYEQGVAGSLPLAISYACNRAVISRYRMISNQAEGVKQYSEGGISTTLFGPETHGAGGGGFDAVVVSMLNPYKRREAV